MSLLSFLLSLFSLLALFSFPGNFKAGESGTILKKLCPKEKKCLSILMQDILRPYVPEYMGDVERDNESILWCRYKLLSSMVRRKYIIIWSKVLSVIPANAVRNEMNYSTAGMFNHNNELSDFMMASVLTSASLKGQKYWDTVG